MNDLISKEKAIEGVRELFSMGDCYCDELSIVGMLNGMPSAETERRKGKWIDTGRKVIYKCSNCGNFLDFNGVNAGRGDANFCPNCGAEMKRDE